MIMATPKNAHNRTGAAERGVPAVVYARVSSKEQELGYSIAAQQNLCLLGGICG